MTDTERDLLASVYLDGEATPDEVALIEGDPELLARVEAFRAVRDRLSTSNDSATAGTVSQETRERHMAAALDLFDSQVAIEPEPDADGQPATAEGGIVDLMARRRRTPVARVPGRQGLSLLTAAAGALVLLIGGVLLASLVGRGSASDSVAMDATSDAAVEETDEAGEAETAGIGEESGGDFADEDAMEESLEDADEEAVEESLEESDAMSDDEAIDAADDSAAALGVAPDSQGSADEDADGGFSPREPVVVYLQQPSSQDLLEDFTLALRDPDSSQCGADYTHPGDGVLIAYLPVEITNPDGQPQIQEALYYSFNNDVEVVVVDPESCQPA